MGDNAKVPIFRATLRKQRVHRELINLFWNWRKQKDLQHGKGKSTIPSNPKLNSDAVLRSMSMIPDLSTESRISSDSGISRCSSESGFSYHDDEEILEEYDTISDLRRNQVVSTLFENKEPQLDGTYVEMSTVQESLLKMVIPELLREEEDEELCKARPAMTLTPPRTPTRKMSLPDRVSQTPPPSIKEVSQLEELEGYETMDTVKQKLTKLTPRTEDENDSMYAFPYVSKDDTDGPQLPPRLYRKPEHETKPPFYRATKKEFEGYSVEELESCFNSCGLNDVANICTSELIDGCYFTTCISDEQLSSDPFFLTPFRIEKVKHVVNGFRPKVSK